jgi:hypothetical protein
VTARAPARRLALLVALALLWAPACRLRPLPEFGSDFERDGDLDLVPWECRTLFRLVPDHATSGRSCLELRLFPAPPGAPDNYPGITFEEFDPRWSRHRVFAFDAYNPSGETVPLQLRIDDREEPPYGDRFDRTIPLAPGANRVRIPLSELAAPRTGRPLELDRIRQVILFLDRPRAPRTLYLDRLRLE